MAIVSAAPAVALRALAEHGREIDARVSVYAADPDPLGTALRRLLDDLGRG